MRYGQKHRSIVALLLLYIGYVPLLLFAGENREYLAGTEALRQKDYKSALLYLNRCIATATSEKVRLECWWEKGWAHWLAGEWQQTVDAWEQVQIADPHRQDLQEYLPQARDNALLMQRFPHADPVQMIDEGQQSTADTTTAQLRIRAVGDMMIATDVPQGYLPPARQNSFGDVVPLLKDADLTFGNLEGVICSGGKTSKCSSGSKNCYAFRTPPSYLEQYVQAGFDLLSLANNHALDFGGRCRQQTERLLDAAGIGYSGRPGTTASVEVDGLRVAMIAFHTARSSYYLNDTKTAMALVRDLASNHHIVIVSFHGGAEGVAAVHVPHGEETYYGASRGNLRVFTHRVVDAGADLVLGHGPHVLRAMEIYKDRLIAYSLGNFATYGRFTISGVQGLGIILEAVLADNGSFIKGRIVPTVQKLRGVPFYDPGAKALAEVRRLSVADFPDTGVRVDKDGNIRKR